MTEKEGCTALANPVAGARRVSVSTKPVTDTANAVVGSAEIVSVRLSSGRRMAFVYNSEAVQKRRANLIANRGLPKVSTADPN